MKVKEVEIAKEVMAGDVSPVAMFIPGKIFGSALFEQFHFHCIKGYEMTASQ